MTTSDRRAWMGQIPLLAFTVLVVAGQEGYARTRDLTESETRQLVMQALDSSARKLPKLAVDPYTDAKSPVPNFYEFSVTWDNPNGAVVVGFFAVNRATGDVWKLVVCSKVESAHLRRLQAALRRRIKLREDEFRKLKDEAPCDP